MLWDPATDSVVNWDAKHEERLLDPGLSKGEVGAISLQAGASKTCPLTPPRGKVFTDSRG